MKTHQHGAGCSHSKQASSKLEQRREQNKVVRKLYTASALCCVFLVVEVSGGLIAGSLAVLSDAAHLFADLAGFAVAIAAAHLAALPTTDQHTFGLKRMESLAALFSMVCLAMVSVGLAWEAVRRLLAPPDEGVDEKLMSGIAMIGVLVNIILAFVLGEHHVHMPGGGGHAHDHEHGSESHDVHAEAAALSNGHDGSHAEEEEKAALSGGHDHDYQHGYGSVDPLDVDVEIPIKKLTTLIWKPHIFMCSVILLRVLPFLLQALSFGSNQRGTLWTQSLPSSFAHWCSTPHLEC
jgi:Co/Zn/Cd efflux system component